MHATLTAPRPIEEMPGIWHLVQTRPKYEIQLGRELDAADVDFFLPTFTRQRVKTTGGRTQILEIESPLFPPYLFLCGDFKARNFAAKSRSTTRITDITDQSRFRRELAAVQKALAAGNTTTANMPRIGAPVRIVAGAYAGWHGVVERIGSHAVHLPLSILGQSVLVEVKLEHIEVAD
jgi:transcription antitermination factor NusG